ncbi:MAG: hypothetical protein PHX43_06835 [Alphaproteobacteria bacterium]|nr:hypothetical protein [Alphaproteobacteria bacterium]
MALVTPVQAAPEAAQRSLQVTGFFSLYGAGRMVKQLKPPTRTGAGVSGAEQEANSKHKNTESQQER